MKKIKTVSICQDCRKLGKSRWCTVPAHAAKLGALAQGLKYDFPDGRLGQVGWTQPYIQREKEENFIGIKAAIDALVVCQVWCCNLLWSYVDGKCPAEEGTAF